jgi:tRNA pseudouridine38-40 synthase
MVRSVVGTMIDVGKQKINIATFRSIIEGKNRGLAGLSVPPQGLELYDIQYPANLKL